MISSSTALAAAGGYCIAETWFYSADTTDVLWPPLMTLTTKKSPITWVTTKIEPSAIPVLTSGSTISQTTRNRPAPASRAASSRLRIDTRHGIEDRHHHEQREQVDVADHDREIRVQQEFQRRWIRPSWP